MAKKITTILLALVLAFVILPFASFADDTATDEGIEPEQTEGYTLAAKNDKLALFADMTTGYFFIEDLQGKMRWYSVPQDQQNDKVTKGITRMLVNSQIQVTYIIEENNALIGNETTESSSAGSLAKDGVKVKSIKNGIRIEYSFPAIEASVPVEYTIKDDCFEATVKTDEITEEKEFIITAIDVLPVFGAANGSANGYLFVPDGSGALIKFNNNSMYNTYKAEIYEKELSVRTDMKKTETQAIRMPVFATLTASGALMGIVTKGDASASITAMAGNENCWYNSVSSQLRYRTISYDTMLSNNANTEKSIYRASKPYSLPEYCVRYYSLSGIDADYVGVAAKYRNYLINEKGLKKQDTNPSFNIDVYGAVEKKGNFLGLTYRKSEALTEYLQTLEIVNAAKKSGIDDVAVRLVGWGKDGTVNYAQQKSVKYSSALGGKNDFKKMSAELSKQKIPLVLESDLLTFRKADKKSQSVTIFKKTAFLYKFMRSVYAIDLRFDAQRLLTPNRFSSNFNSYIKSCKKNNINNLSLSTLTDIIYSDFRQKNTFDRSQFPQAAEKALKSFCENGISVSGDAANAYTFSSVSRIYSAPSTSSAYKLFDKEVPFYQIVLHGYIPMTTEPLQQTSEPLTYFLKAIESGSELLYNGIYGNSELIAGTFSENIYSSDYKYWLSRATDYYKQYQPLLKKIHNQTVSEHKEIMPDVMMTVYSNNIGVIVNYSANTVSAEGIQIKPYSFAEIKAD